MDGGHDTAPGRAYGSAASTLATIAVALLVASCASRVRRLPEGTNARCIALFSVIPKNYDNVRWLRGVNQAFHAYMNQLTTADTVVKVDFERDSRYTTHVVKYGPGVRDTVKIPERSLLSGQECGFDVIVLVTDLQKVWVMNQGQRLVPTVVAAAIRPRYELRGRYLVWNYRTSEPHSAGFIAAATDGDVNLRDTKETDRVVGELVSQVLRKMVMYKAPPPDYGGL